MQPRYAINMGNRKIPKRQCHPYLLPSSKIIIIHQAEMLGVKSRTFEEKVAQIAVRIQPPGKEI
jgi:uncharacterized membrane protein YdbT with pleckstrin-like domain